MYNAQFDNTQVGFNATGTPEVADVSTADHEFSGDGARLMRVYASADGQTVTFKPKFGSEDILVTLAAGVEYLPFIVTHIRHSGTTASEIVGLL